MKVLTFNINGIRARPHQLEAIVEKIEPDVIGLQETKVQDQDFPIEMVENLGYQVVYHGQKSHYGVATLSKIPMDLISKNYPKEHEDVQRRTLITKHVINGKEWTVLNGYFPQGENRAHETKFPDKERYYNNLTQFAKDNKNNPTILMGDFNIAPQDIDIGLETADQWIKRGACSFLPEEREWYQHLLDQGYADTWRHVNPKESAIYSWFDYRTRAFERTIKKGLRIDHILTNHDQTQNVKEVGIDYSIRSMEKPSDHVPVWTEFS